MGDPAHGVNQSAEFFLSNYRLGKTLGIGSFGKVKVAEHVTTGHKVAIKILNKKKIKHMDMEEKVRREIKILRLFMHPHIIRLYEVIETTNDIYVVMEYVKMLQRCMYWPQTLHMRTYFFLALRDAGELYDYVVEKGRLLEEEARRFFQQVTSGVEYCHRNMVVHRDLKPENLLLDSKMNVKIADFGLSNVMRDGHFLKTSCGSPNYAAPEVISGKLYGGPEVDVWSCGVILYALLCGSLPFDDENIPNLFKKIKGGIYNLPSHLSPGARDLIAKMLLVDPLKRITIPEIRQHPWFNQHLLRYLAVIQADTMATSPLIDTDMVDEVTKLGFDRDEVIQSIKHRQQNKASVAYYLMSDNRRHMPSSAYLRAEMTEASDVTSSRHPGGAEGSTAAPARQVVAERRWRLAMQSQARPSSIMRDVLACLQQNQVSWKKKAPYNLKCRKAIGLADGAEAAELMDKDDLVHDMESVSPRSHEDNLPVSQQRVLKFELQLYKLKDSQYLLDIQRLQGEVFLFMDMCGSLLATLRL